MKRIYGFIILLFSVSTGFSNTADSIDIELGLGENYVIVLKLYNRCPCNENLQLYNEEAYLYEIEIDSVIYAKKDTTVFKNINELLSINYMLVPNNNCLLKRGEKIVVVVSTGFNDSYLNYIRSYSFNENYRIKFSTEDQTIGFLSQFRSNNLWEILYELNLISETKYLSKQIIPCKDIILDCLKMYNDY